MVDSYVNDLEGLLEKSVPELGRKTDIDVWHFFGGAAAYADGRIFMSLTPAGLALKLSEEDLDIMRDLGAKPLRYFPTAPIKKNYLLLPDAITDDAAALAIWIEKSADYALTLPKPPPKSGGR
jgi:TfoX/Sxy family transcriptional regulator of competence genes